VSPEIFRETAKESAGDGGNPYIVYCANCLDTFKRTGKECYHILEKVFPADNNSADSESRLIIAPEVVESMERLLIRQSEILDVIKNAAQSGGEFVSEDSTITASLVIGVLTYWVKYRKLGDKYEILSAYYHRMKINR